jgi:predicted GNAT family N-acyltransferase
MADVIVPLNEVHRRTDFTCGNSILDRYFHEQVTQDIRKKACTCFVLADADNKVKGYYTLSSAGISRELIPDGLQKKLLRYKELPVTLLGRLAIDKNMHKQGLGEQLLVDALQRSFEVSSSAVGSLAVIVDPTDEAAKKFYGKYGFILLPDSGKMFLPMKTIDELLEERKKN